MQSLQIASVPVGLGLVDRYRWEPAATIKPANLILSRAARKIVELRNSDPR